MNKDAILATLLGFGIGLFIMGIILIGPKLAKNFPKISLPKLPSITLPKIELGKKQVQPSITPAPTEDILKGKLLIIESPIDESIEHEGELLVSGATVPSSTLIIQSESDDVVVIAGTDGKYAGKVNLSEGKNTITVTTYGKDQSPASESVTVYFTPEEF